MNFGIGVGTLVEASLGCALAIAVASFGGTIHERVYFPAFRGREGEETSDNNLTGSIHTHTVSVLMILGCTVLFPL